MKKEDIKKKYEKIRLGYRDYESDDKYVDDFQDFDVVVDWLSLMPERYTDLTKEGYMFIEEYHGIDNVLKAILKNNPDFPFDGQEPREYLESMGKNAISGK